MYCKWFKEECNSIELLKTREEEVLTDSFGNVFEGEYDCNLKCNECKFSKYD